MMDLTATNKGRLHRKRLAFLVSLTAVFLALGIGAAVAAVGGVWNSKAPLGGEGFAASIIGSNIYVSHGFRPEFGGADSTRLDIYDIATDLWSPGAPATMPRSELVGAAAGGRHYAIGGRFTTAVTAVEVYDPGPGTWSTGTSMPTARRGLGAATIGDKIYVVGGSTGTAPHGGTPLAANEVLDTGLNTWSALAPMPIPMMGVYATVPWGGKVYVFGGYDGAAVSGAVQIYDPASDTWSAGAPMPTPRSNGLAGVCGRNIFVIGGIPNNFSNLAVNEAYNPSTDTWDTAPPMPVPGSEFAVSGVAAFGDIHAIGSGTFGAAQDIHEVFTCPPSTVGGATTFSTGDSGTSAGTIIGFAAVAAAVVALVASGAWYTRKRRQGEKA